MKKSQVFIIIVISVDFAYTGVREHTGTLKYKAATILRYKVGRRVVTLVDVLFAVILT
jgi:hypothetical protein